MRELLVGTRKGLFVLEGEPGGVCGLGTYVSGDASLMSRDMGHTRRGLG